MTRIIIEREPLLQRAARDINPVVASNNNDDDDDYDYGNECLFDDVRAMVRTNDGISASPAPPTDPNEHRKKFPKIPILYLELIENKIKTRPDVAHKTYEPQSTATSVVSSPPAPPMTSPVLSSTNFTTTTAMPASPDAANGAETTAAFAADDALPSPPRAPTLGELRAKAAAAGAIPSLSPKSDGGASSTTDSKTAAAGASGSNDTTTTTTAESAVDPEEVRKRERQDVYFKYQVLKRMHPTADIPEFTVWSDPKIMADKYDMIVKQLSLDSSVSSWKRYMMIFVMVCEVVLGHLNFDMEGFAQQQIISMSTYDSLLVEMAEKSYVPRESQWPVELRLFATLLANIVLFVVTKIIAKRSGTNLLGTINGIAQQQQQQQQHQQQHHQQQQQQQQQQQHHHPHAHHLHGQHQSAPPTTSSSSSRGEERIMKPPPNESSLSRY